MAVLVFLQTLVPAIILAPFNLIFIESLNSQLPLHAPHVNVAAIIDTGDSGFRAIVEPGNSVNCGRVLLAYSNSKDRVFYFLAAMAAMRGLVFWGFGW